MVESKEHHSEALNNLKAQLWLKIQTGHCHFDDVDTAIDDAVGIGAVVGVEASEIGMTAIGINYWITDEAIHVELKKH